MAILLNLRHEAFAQGVAQGLSSPEAYERAGYKRHDGNCSRLKNSELVRERILELRGAVARKIQATRIVEGMIRNEESKVTVESLTQMLFDDRKLARELGQAAAAVSAVKELGILAGVRIERAELGRPGQFEAMSDADLRNYIIEGSRALEIEDSSEGNETVN